MVTIKLTDEDLVRVQVIMTDRDEEDALAFIRERIMPQVRQQQEGTMRSHLEGGKGSIL